MNGYYVWRHHGEKEPLNINTEFGINTDASSSGAREECDNFGQMQDMVGDALGVNLSYEGSGEEEIIPNEKALKFYAMMNEVNKPLFEGASDSKLSMCVRLLAAKSNWNVPEDCLEFFSKMMLDATPVKDNMPASYYDAKRLVSKLGLQVKKIDCCVQGCMLFYDNEFGTNDGTLEECKFCNAPRYQVRNSDVHRKQKKVAVKSMFYLPIIPRLQRLFASMQTASQMTWHYYNKTSSNVMRHPCDGLAWKHFDAMHPGFAEDPRNVRLGLCSDGFTPYIQASATPYSCWPVIVTPYNLPPDMCMTKPYMFLSCIIPGPSNPTDGIDVYLQPLIDDLKRLWVGELTYDIARKENFTMRAALMWTINDFPAYGMLSGWSTHGRLACPHCMEHTKSFTLKNGGKTTWFDCHRRFLPKNHQFRRKKNLFKKETTEMDGPPPKITSYEVFDRVSGLWKFPDVGKRIIYDGYGEWHNWTKRSIFWDLPYWKANLLRHNLDVMHIEKNFCDNILHTVMNVSGKTKDNEKARLDLPLYCKRPEMELQLLPNGKYLKPKAVYSLTSDEAKYVCQWLKELRMPDGYSSNLARCADVNTGRLRGMKSHDSHVLMEHLLPIAFCSLPNHVLNPLTEISQFFKDLCASTLRMDELVKMDQNIPIILCKLEQPPAYQPPAYQTPVYQTPAYQPHSIPQGALFTDNARFMDMMLETFVPHPQQQPQEQQQPQQHQQQQQQPQEQQHQQQPHGQQQPQQGEEYRIVTHSRRKYNKEVKCLGNKFLVYPVGLGLEPCREAAFAIRKAIRTVYKKCYPTYDHLIKDEDVKKEIFEVFSGLCAWEPHLHDDVERSFHHTAADRLKDMLYDAREAYKVKNTPQEQYRPKWIGKEAWNELLQYWENDPHFKNRSAANKGNRSSSKGGSLHTQGSVSVSTHAQDLVQKGGDVDIAKFHKETHFKKKTGGYVDQRSETTQASYDDAILKYLQEHPEYSCYEDIPLIIRRDIWMQVTGPGTKNSKYGFGKLAPNVRYENLLHVPTPEERSRPVALPPAAQAEIQRLTQELQAQREELNRRAQIEQQMQDRLDCLDREAEERRAMMNEQFRKTMDEQRRQMDEYFRQMASSSRNAPNDQTNSTDDEASNESDSEDADN